MGSAANLRHPASRRNFRRKLLAWYRANRRLLPWRSTRDPYRIWISEIMLQQTRVAVVLEYYQRFLLRFPTIDILAAANEAEILAQWSGLGYYRRARMLHRAAIVVQTEHAGRLPSSSRDLLELPGIGRYTANAIASIASGESVAVVDGNVQRVIARVLGKKVSGEKVWTAAQGLLDPEAPGDFNQAMMELGATVCVPGVPLCAACPINTSCASRGMKHAPRTLPEERARKSASLSLVRRGQRVLLRRRSQNERLMPGMWELPPCKGRAVGKPLLQVKHSITTTDWTVALFSQNRVPARPDSEWVSLSAASQLPLTGLTRKILRKLQLLV